MGTRNSHAHGEHANRCATSTRNDSTLGEEPCCCVPPGVFREGERWDGRVALRALLRTASEVARGLWHLHDNGIVHGDIKPANILLASSGEDRRGFTAKVRPQLN